MATTTVHTIRAAKSALKSGKKVYWIETIDRRRSGRTRIYELKQCTFAWGAWQARIASVSAWIVISDKSTFDIEEDI